MADSDNNKDSQEDKLFYLLIGGKPKGRHIEQHDVFFAIGKTVADVIDELKSFWSDCEKLHIDCWREVSNVNGFQIKIVSKDDSQSNETALSLFFINIGGYRKGEFNEFHSFELMTAANQSQAIALAKQTSFYKKYTFKGAVSHIDDKYGVDIDAIYEVNEILSKADKNKYRVLVTNDTAPHEDELHIGYTTLSKLR